MKRELIFAGFLLPFFAYASSFTKAAIEQKDAENDENVTKKYEVDEHVYYDEDYVYQEEDNNYADSDDEKSDHSKLLDKIEILMSSETFSSLSTKLANAMRSNLLSLAKDMTITTSVESSIERAVSNFANETKIHMTSLEIFFSSQFINACFACGLIDATACDLAQRSLIFDLESRADGRLEIPEEVLIEVVMTLVRQRKVKEAVYLLKSARPDSYSLDFFDECVSSGHVHFVKMLLQSEINLNFIPYIQKAIFSAAQNEQIDLLRFLVEEIDPAMRYHPEAYMNECRQIAKESNLETLKIYLKALEKRQGSKQYEDISRNSFNEKPKPSVEAIKTTFFTDYSDLVTKLVSYRYYAEAKEILMEQVTDGTFFKLLSHFALFGYLEMVVFMADFIKPDRAFATDVEIYESFYQALHLATHHNQIEVAKYLIDTIVKDVDGILAVDWSNSFQTGKIRLSLQVAKSKNYVKVYTHFMSKNLIRARFSF